MASPAISSELLFEILSAGAVASFWARAATARDTLAASVCSFEFNRGQSAWQTANSLLFGSEKRTRLVRTDGTWQANRNITSTSLFTQPVPQGRPSRF